jgi:branched-subunit amino acid aminotransferase/4-amino-4-deoxychorismate lyase
MPIVQVDGATVGAGTPGPITTQLRAAYIDSVRHGGAAAP